MDLLPELLRDISGRLHHSIDFVRFHAVCRSWRNSRDAMAIATTQSFLPWLIAPSMEDQEALRLTCVFSKTSYKAPTLPERPCWLANADGTAIRYFGSHPYTSLHDPITGATTVTPPIPEGKDRLFNFVIPRGVRYDDGTILLYLIHDIRYEVDVGDTTKFKAALMRPGDATWTVVERTFEELEYGLFSTAYYRGKILVSLQDSQWHVVMPNDDVASDILVPRPSMPTDEGDYYYISSHVLESRGELLWATLHILDSQDGCRDNICNLVQALSMTVYELQEEVSSPSNKIRWVRKDGKSLADRLLFLGWDNSFALDASQLGVDGGYAYFVYNDGKVGQDEWSAVFRYNLIDNKAEFVEWLPQGWQQNKYAWLVPQPTVAPFQVCDM